MLLKGGLVSPIFLVRRSIRFASVFNVIIWDNMGTRSVSPDYPRLMQIIALPTYSIVPVITRQFGLTMAQTLAGVAAFMVPVVGSIV